MDPIGRAEMKRKYPRTTSSFEGKEYMSLGYSVSGLSQYVPNRVVQAVKFYTPADGAAA